MVQPRELTTLIDTMILFLPIERKHQLVGILITVIASLIALILIAMITDYTDYVAV